MEAKSCTSSASRKRKSNEENKNLDIYNKMKEIIMTAIAPIVGRLD